MNANLPKIALTAGEPAGIGLDLCVMLAQQPIAAKIIVIGDQYALQKRAQMLNLPLNICADEVPHLGKRWPAGHAPSACRACGGWHAQCQ